MVVTRQRPFVVATIVLAVVAARAGTGHGPSRLRVVSHEPALKAEWIVPAAGAAGRPIHGAGRTLQVPGGPALEVGGDVADAVRFGRWLVLAVSGQGLRYVDTHASWPEIHAFLSKPSGLAVSGSTRLATLGDHLLVAQGSELHVLRVISHHAHDSEAFHGTPLESRHVATLPMGAPIEALVAAGERAYLATAGELLEIDLLAPSAPSRRRILSLAVGTRDLAVAGRQIVLLTSAGLRIVDLDAPDRDPEVRTDLAGSRVEWQGRVLWLASPQQGLQTLRDDSPRAQQYTVSLGATWFTPEQLSLDVGDSVRWSNSFGFHNVYSCTTTQNGCTVESNEAFTSGSPSQGPWVYSHTFIEGGENPYLCQSHAPFMLGHVSVSAPDSGPPEVPDGVSGAPLRVDKLDGGGGSLAVSWDNASCPAGAIRILFGGGAGFPKSTEETYPLLGSVCAVSAPSSHLWNPAPDPALDPEGLLWWIVVAADEQGREGSWGRSGTGAERTGNGPGGASGECGVTERDISNACGSRLVIGRRGGL